MNNNSSTLVLFGTVIILNLVLALGMQVYNSAASNIEPAILSMKTAEIEAFNNQFELYHGNQTGSQVSALTGRLIANANTFADEPEKCPTVICEKISSTTDESINAVFTDKETYLVEIAKIKNNVENKHIYSISFNYSSSGLLDKIIIEY